MFGFISLSLISKSFALFCPTVDCRATICLFIFERETSSKSIIVNSPIPARVRASAQNPPTPPSPKTATCFKERRL